MRFLVSILLIAVLAGCGKSVNKILKSKDAPYKLKIADQYYAKKKYGKAQLIYNDVIPYYKASPEAQDIYYKNAYAAYYQKDYEQAENIFKEFLEAFPNSLKYEEVEYMRAYSFYKRSPKPELDQTNTIKAIGMLQTFVNTHPNSVRNTEATRLIEELRNKLETKEYRAAKLYYDMEQYRAAAVAFTTLLDNYPESASADEYKLMAVKSYFLFAEKSIYEKKAERFGQVITECDDFINRFPDSKYRKQIENYITLSQQQLKTINNNNEQIKASA
ncbi:MAG: outer membrane protein assembly factor BamD [Niabella sp.]